MPVPVGCSLENELTRKATSFDAFAGFSNIGIGTIGDPIGDPIGMGDADCLLNGEATDAIRPRACMSTPVGCVPAIALTPAT